MCIFDHLSPQGELCPELVQKQLELLENRYRGSQVANRAATIIQRAWREYSLRCQFMRMVNLAKSVENVSKEGKRLSMLEPIAAGSSLEVEVNVDSGDVTLTMEPEEILTSPASRHIRKGKRQMRRSTSMREHRRSGSWSGFEPIERPPVEPCHCGGSPTNTEEKPSNSWNEGQRPKTAADLQNLMNAAREAPTRPVAASPTASPVPPCPPLRGEDFYPEQESIAFGRDSLYCSVRRPRRLPPRPPQRTVSFLASESTSRPTPGMQMIANQHRPSISASCLPSQHPRGLSLPVPTEVTSHNRSFSSPDAQPLYQQSLQKRSPLPPPPYVSPPTMQRSSPNEPLPPPPEHIERPPCDSVSSIDSGFRSSCSDSTSSTEAASVPTSPCQPFLEVPEDPYSYWVGSPALLTSPDTAQFYRATVSQESLYAPRPPMPCTAGCFCGQPIQQLGPPAQINVYDTYQDVYEQLNKQQQQSQSQIYGHYQPAKEAPRTKKTVRIQLPSDEREASEDEETLRRRQYRVGLNMFNTNPQRGIEYLVKKEFVEYSPPAVAKFLLGRKGLSRKMVGEYICSLQKAFNIAVLHCFIVDMDFSGLHLDIALRQLLAEVRAPGEAQKIEKLVEVFAKRYIECNQMFVSSFKSPDTIFVLSYAMVLLNTDLHNKSNKPERKMKQEDFIRNLRGIDCGSDIDLDMVKGIFDRIKAAEFKQGSDHVSQVTKVQETIVGSKRPNLNSSWRRLVCFCRVTEVADVNKKEKKDVHQRGLFLFNDLLVVTKNEKSKKKQLHQHRYTLGLSDLRVNMYRTTHHQFGVQLQERHTGRVAATFACRSYNDQQRFVSDLQESIAEVEEMDRARLFINESESIC